MRHRNAWLALVLGALATALLGACSSSDETSDETTGFFTPTSLVVDPKAFLGDVPCSTLPGAMKSYVATRIDLDVEGEEARVSSPPTACSKNVAFRNIRLSHHYRVEIDGYEAEPCIADTTVAGAKACPGPDFIVSEGGPSSGNRQMITLGVEVVIENDKSVERVVTMPVSPRWTSGCDRFRREEGAGGAGGSTGTEGASPIANRPNYFSGCTPLVDHGSSPTAVEVDPTAALGLFECVGSGAGTIERFDVVPQASTLPAITGLSCGQGTAVYDATIQPDTSYSFLVQAYEAGAANPSYEARCSATSRTSLTVRATCDPLGPIAMP